MEEEDSNPPNVIISEEKKENRVYNSSQAPQSFESKKDLEVMPDVKIEYINKKIETEKVISSKKMIYKENE